MIAGIYIYRFRLFFRYLYSRYPYVMLAISRKYRKLQQISDNCIK